ncbi:hypothetical protein Tco_0567991 [Tanacetum coccineum]
MEECHKLLTDQVDDTILRYNVSTPLPLGGEPGHVTIQPDFFFNKDLEYLRYGRKVGRPALSISKMKAAYYPDVGLEQLVPDQFWIESECKYDIAAMYGISHWWFQRQRFYIDRFSSEGDRRAVRTHMRILSVVRIEVFSMYGYNYMKKIVLRRADLKEYVIAERDFKYMYPSNFEDLYLLNLQGHLNHLSPEDKKILTTVVNLWTRNLVIRQRVEDFQLGIENKYGVQMIMRFNEIHKFSDGTLQQIDEALDYRVKEFRINRTNPGMNARFWTKKDVDRSKDFMFAIQKRLKTRRIFRNLESFVGGRIREGDYRSYKDGKVRYSLPRSRQNRRDLPRDNPLVSVEVLRSVLTDPEDQVMVDDKEISICQEQYTRNLLKKYEISDSSSMKTPMVPLNNLGPDLASKSVNETLYKGMIGSLMYLTAIRPDIQFSIVLCARYQSNPKESHLIAVKRILEYLNGTPTLGLYYPKCLGFDLKGYSDSYYAGCNMDRKRSSSSCQICEGKDHILKGDIELYFIPIEYQLADIFTKPLDEPTFTRLKADYPQTAPTYKDICKFLMNCPLAKAFTKTHSVVYQNFLKVFWCTAIAYDPNLPINDSKAHPLNEYLIKFSVMNNKKPLILDFKTFVESTGLYYAKCTYVSYPSPKAVKMIAYCLITGTKVDIGEIIYSDLVTKLTRALSKKRQKHKSKKTPTKTQVTPPTGPTEGSEQSHSVSSNNVPNPQDPERNIQLVGMGFPFTQLDEGTRKSQPLLESTTIDPKDSGGNVQPVDKRLPSTDSDEGTVKTTPLPEAPRGDKDSEGLKPPADMEPLTNPVADLSRTSAKYHVDETQSTKLRASIEGVDLLKALNGVTEILKAVQEAIKEDHTLNMKVLEATEAYTANSHNITKLLSLAKTFDFFVLKSLVKNVKLLLMLTMINWQPGLRLLHLCPGMLAPYIQRLSKLRLLCRQISRPSKACACNDPDAPILVPYEINEKNFQLTEEQIQAYMDKEEHIKKAAEEAKMFKMTKTEVIKVVQEEAEKIGLDPKTIISAKACKKFKKAQDAKNQVLKREHSQKVKRLMELNKKSAKQYMWTISNRLKPEPIIDVKIHPNSKPSVLTLDELGPIIQKKKNTIVKDLMVSLVKRYERLKKIHEELGIQLALPAPIPKQAPSQTSGRKRKHMELEPKIKVPKDIHKVGVDSLVSYLVMALMIKTLENARFSLKLKKLIAENPDQEKLQS